jgi:hypothetical protein
MRVTSPPFRPRSSRPQAEQPAASPTTPPLPRRRYRARRSWLQLAGITVRRCLAVVALGAAVWAVASWGVAPMLRASHGSHTTHGAKTTPTVSNSPLGGQVPGLAQPSDASFRDLKIGILDGSGASRSHAALNELARLQLRSGPVRPVGKVRSHDLLVYARGAGKQGRVVASMLGVKARARDAWHGPQLPPTTLVYVLGAD